MSAPADVIQAALDRAQNGPQFEVHPLGAPTNAEVVAQQEAARAAPAPDRLPLGSAVENDSLTFGLLRSAVERGALPTDPNYVPPAPDSPEFKTLTNGVPPEYWPKLAAARSAVDAEFIKNQIHTELDATQKLEEAGWTGTALRMGTTILDPVTLAATLATGGASFITSGSRLARAAKLGLAAGAENVALEASLLGTHETKSADDLYVALIGGIVTGGTLGALLPAASRAKLYETGKDIAGGGAGPGKVATEVNIGLDDQLSVGAAQSSRAPRELLTEQPSPEILNTPQLKGVEAKLRFDWYGQIAKSDNPYVRHLGNLLLEDPVGIRGEVQAASAEEFASVLKRRSMTFFYRDANPALQEYLSGVPMRERGAATDRFFESVTNAVRAQDFTDPAVGRVAQSMMRALKTTAEEAKRFGVKGFEDLDLSEGYVPRIPSAAKIDQLVHRFGNPQIEALLAASFSKATTVSGEVARQVARGYLHNVRMRGAGALTDFSVTVADRDAFAGMMRTAGIGEAEIAQVTGALKTFGEADATQAGKIARAKRRLSLDETVTAKLKDTAGEVVPVAITDLFENDARTLTQMYVNSVGGHAALARAGIRSPAEWETALNNARRYATDRLGQEAKARDLEITRLQSAHSILTGKPLLDYSDPVRGLSLATRESAYLAQSGAFGFAQASELGAVTITGGFRLLADAVPEMKAIFTRGANGTLDNEFAREMEDFWAPGTDAVLHVTGRRFSGLYDENLVPQPGSLLEKTAGARHTLTKAAGYASGLTPLTVGMGRLSARFIAQRVVNTAFGEGRGYSTGRLLAMGLDEKMQARVFKQIEAHAAQQIGAAGRTIQRLDLEKWTDLDARDAFVLAVNREGSRTVLRPTLGGSSHLVTNSELAKVLTQFMGFAMQSHSRLLLHGIKNMDAERAVNWMFGMGLAGLAYVARTHLDVAAKKDREKLLRERLTPEKIAAAAFNMSGFSALLPPAHDTAAKLIPGMDPWFSYSRTSGLGSGLGLSSFPAGAMVAGAADTASSMHDKKFTRQDWQNVQRLLPFSRVIGVQQALDAIGNGLPEK